MKRYIAILLSFILLVSACPNVVFSSEVLEPSAEQDTETTDEIMRPLFRYRERTYRTTTNEELDESWVLYDMTTGYTHSNYYYIYPLTASKGGTSSGYTDTQASQWRLANENKYCFHSTHIRVYEYIHKTNFSYIYVTDSDSVDYTKYSYVRDCWRFQICGGKEAYTIYHYYQWSEWSEWSETPIIASEDVEVEKIGPDLLYRYRDKATKESTTKLEKPWVLDKTTTEYYHDGSHDIYLPESATIESSYCVHLKQSVRKYTYTTPNGTYITYAASLTDFANKIGNVELLSYSYKSGYVRYLVCLKKTPYTLYHYSMYGEWSEWSYTPVAESENIDVEYRIDIKFTITFDANGGDNAPEKMEKYYDEVIELSSDVPSRVNYRFLGWSTTADGGVEYLPGDEFSLDRDITLYAVWKNVTEYNISYNANGGTDAPSSQSKIHDEEMILSDVVPVRTGFVFQGWAVALDADVMYAPKDCYYENADVTLYAVWESCTHQWDDGEIIIEPEHTSVGTELFTCIDCSATRTEDVAKLSKHSYGEWQNHNVAQHQKTCECGDVVYSAHNWDDGTITISPTCDVEGEKTFICLDCRAIKKESVPKSTDHAYESTTIVSPGCTTNGVIKYICEICGDGYVGTINAIGHTEMIDNALPPSCTKTGLTAGKHCSVCGVTLLKQTEVKALGHTEVISKGYEATCTEEGLTDSVHCSVCKEVLTEASAIDAKGHSADKDWTTISTSDAGKITQVKYCTDCRDVVETRDITQDITNPSNPTDPTEPSTGEEDKPTDSTESTEPVLIGVLGDVNGDGKVNIKDATLIQKLAASLVILDEVANVCADVNGDSKVNVKDATAIQKWVADIETGFLIGELVKKQ